MNVIIEGPDCSGKTTLANYLMEHFFLDYRHSSSKTKNDFEYHESLLESNNLVLDRFHLGEYIFPALVNREPKMNFDDLIILTSMIEEGDNLLVILYSSNVDLLKERLKHRGDDDFTISHIESINDMFKMFAVSIFHQTRHVIGIDVATHDPIEVVRKKILEGSSNEHFLG